VNSEFQYVHDTSVSSTREDCVQPCSVRLAEARETLLDVDHAPAVRKGARGIAVGHAARHLVGREKAEPDQQLIAEVGVTTRK